MSKPGYQHLLTYQQLEEIYDLTSQFCERFLPGRENLRIREQMVHAARSAKQCLVEGYEQESLKGYIKLTGVSRGSLKELLEDYKDFARNHQVEVWGKRDKRVKHMLAQRKQRKQGPKWTLPLIPFHPFNPLYPVNYMLNLVNMTTYLLDRQIDSLKEKFIKEGGWTETIFKKRLVYRQKQLGFTLVELLITLAIFVTIAAAGVVAWNRKMNTVITPVLTPELTPTPSSKTKIQVLPTRINSGKMPWEDSICGNGICERCESRSECCNYPCVTDPISGNQMCPPPTCLGWCEKDCTNITLAPTPITSCQTDTDCKNACAVPNFGLKVYHEVCIQGKCILEPCN